MEETEITVDNSPKSFGPGVWFSMTSICARARTLQTMKHAVSIIIPILINLLCSKCSGHAKEIILKRHPPKYYNKVDHRGELIGMFLWIHDIHNDVNARIGVPHFPLEAAMAIYEPILSLSKEEVERDARSALDVSMIDNIVMVNFFPDVDEEEIKQLEPVENIVNAPESSPQIQAQDKRLRARCTTDC